MSKLAQELDKLAQELDASREHLVPRWDEERAARLYSGVGQLRRRRAVARVGLGTLAAVSAAMLVLFSGGTDQTDGLAGATSHNDSVTAPALGQAAAGQTVNAGQLRLADGSTASMVGEHSELEILSNTPARVAMRLHQGQAHFDVVPNAERSFAVESGPYRVVVLGTIFDVVSTADQVVVQVARGKVRVYGPSGAQDVAAGERHAFLLDAPGELAEVPPLLEGTDQDDEPGLGDEPDEPDVDDGDDARAADGAEAAKTATRAKPRRLRGARDGNSWRSLSRSGDYDAAFQSLRAGGVVDDEPSALMDAADAARLSGHANSAVKYLERVVRDHAKSPVAPLAAFTLGRVYLDRLGHPHKAAQAFGMSRTLAPRGSLAQDALAREVEALSKGGDAQGAYARAQEYMRRYPSGRRVRAVQLYGGLD